MNGAKRNWEREPRRGGQGGKLLRLGGGWGEISKKIRSQPHKAQLYKNQQTTGSTKLVVKGNKREAQL